MDRRGPTRSRRNRRISHHPLSDRRARRRIANSGRRRSHRSMAAALDDPSSVLMCASCPSDAIPTRSSIASPNDQSKSCTFIMLLGGRGTSVSAPTENKSIPAPKSSLTLHLTALHARVRVATGVSREGRAVRGAAAFGAGATRSTPTLRPTGTTTGLRLVVRPKPADRIAQVESGGMGSKQPRGAL